MGGERGTVLSALRALLDEQAVADGMTAYYAFYHPADKTTVVPSQNRAGVVDGFVTVSRTGIDLFRPLLTMRLPLADLERSRALLWQVLPAGQEAFTAVPESHLPLLRAVCEIQSEEPLLVYALPRQWLNPHINVLVVREDEEDGSPCFVIKQLVEGQRTAVAVASLNWLSPYFGELAVRTRPEYRQRGFGRSVVAALADYLLAHSRTPLYVVNAHNAPSIHLAQSLGFVDTGVREWMLEIKMRPNR